jgi:hypothetical protein
MKFDFTSTSKDVSDRNSLSSQEKLVGAIELSDEEMAGVSGAKHHRRRKHHRHHRDDFNNFDDFGDDDGDDDDFIVRRRFFFPGRNMFFGGF